MVYSAGMDGLKSNQKQLKDLSSKVIESCFAYYAAKKRDNKAKQKKLVNKELAENVRYSFKVGIYS